MNKAITLLTLLLLLLWGQGQAQTKLDISQGSITINDRGYEQNGTASPVENNTYIITQTNNSQSTANNITITGGTINVTLQDVNIELGDNPIWVQGGATLNLTVSGENTLKSFWNAGIRVTEDASLVIDGGVSDKLFVTGGRDQTGIGENNRGNGGSVTIRGGYVWANSPGSGAGIGKPQSGRFQSVRIEGGYVDARCGKGDPIESFNTEIISGVVRINQDKDIFVGENVLFIQNGKVRNDAILIGDYLLGESEPVTVGKDVTITIQEGSTLTLNKEVTFSNYGTITGEGKLINYGFINNAGSFTVDYSGEGTKVDAGFEISGSGNYEETEDALKLQGGDLTFKGKSFYKYILVEKDTRLTIDGLQMDLTRFSVDKSPIEIAKGVQLTLVLKGESRLAAHKLMSAIHVPEGATLVVSEESTGSLVVKGGERAAGIGGYGVDEYEDTSVEKAGSILIYGGKITAEYNTGGEDDEVAVALGGGYGRVGKQAIGSQKNGSSGGSVEKIAIYGGEVIVPTGHIGAGSGRKCNSGGTGGKGGTVESMIIAGGNIQAKSVGGGDGGGRLYDNNGTYGLGGNVTEFIISGGTLTAEWIGAGSSLDTDPDKQGKCDLTITGGSVKLTDTNPFHYAEPKDAAGNPLFLAITPELENYNSLSVDDQPYFIDSYHPKGDKKFYFYLPETPGTVYIRNASGEVTAYTLAKKGSEDANGNNFTFSNGTTAMPNKIVQVKSVVNNKITVTYGEEYSFAVSVAADGTQEGDLSVAMNVLHYQLYQDGGNTLVREGNIPVKKDAAASVSIELNGLSAGEYLLKVQYGGSHEIRPSAVFEQKITVDKAAAPGVADLKVDIPTDEVYKPYRLYPVFVALTEPGNWEEIEESQISINYYKVEKDGTETLLEDTPSPANAGDYRFEVVIADNKNYKGATLTHEDWRYTVAKATPTVGDFEFLLPLPCFEKGSTIELEIFSREGMGKYEISYYDEKGNEPVTDPSGAYGFYSFKIKVVEEGDNYTTTTEPLSCELWLFQVTPPVTTDDYYELASTEDLYWFCDMLEMGMSDLDVRLTADIDLSESGNWTPIQNYSDGIFDGNGHVIKGMKIVVDENSKASEEKYVGFFSGLSCSVVMNLGFVDAEISCENKPAGTSLYAGTLAGYANNGSILNCFEVDCKLPVDDPSAGVYSGGLVGYSDDSFPLLCCYTQHPKLIGQATQDTYDKCSFCYANAEETENEKVSSFSPEDLQSGKLVYVLRKGWENYPKEMEEYDKCTWGQELGRQQSYPVPYNRTDEDAKAAKAVYVVTCYNPASETPDEPVLSTYGNAGDYSPEIKLEREGYAFIGWSANKEGEDGSLTVTITDDTQLYAVWSRFYTITQQEVVNGSITVQESALSGDKVTIACTPDNGYMFGNCTVTTDADPAEEVALTFDETSGTYTFTMPSGNVTISATFKEVTYAIAKEEVVNGSIEVKESALFEEEVSITCTPDNGYTFGTCTVTTDADPAEEVALTFDETSGTYTFTMPSGNVTISATFKEVTYAIAKEEVVNGSIEVKESALFEEEVSITCTPDNGYTFGNCTVIAADSEFSITLIPGDMPGTFTFIMPACDVTVSAIFVEEHPGGGDDGDGDDGDGDDNDGDDNDNDGDGDDDSDDDGDDDGEDLDPVANTEVGHTEPTARVINGNLLLSVPETTEAVLFNFNGRALRRLQLPVGDTWINDLPVGPYIVRFDGKKVVKLVINR